MDLSFSKDQEIFRTEVRDFLSQNLDSNMSSKMKLGIMLSKEEIEAWHSKLNEKGWLAGSWPKKYGGQNWGVIDGFGGIFEGSKFWQFSVDNDKFLGSDTRILPYFTQNVDAKKTLQH